MSYHGARTRLSGLGDIYWAATRASDGVVVGSGGSTASSIDQVLPDPRTQFPFPTYEVTTFSSDSAMRSFVLNSIKSGTTPSVIAPAPSTTTAPKPATPMSRNTKIAIGVGVVAGLYFLLKK